MNEGAAVSDTPKNMMKIATYNVWNETRHIGDRTEPLLREIIGTDADIIGLQEVLPSFWEILIERAGYAYHECRMIPHRGDGLALLSKYPLENRFFLHDSAEFQNSLALSAEFQADGMTFCVTNAHLPWDSVAAREKQTVAVNEYARRQKERVDFFLLLGDFNCSHRSSVHNFLTGGQTLLNCEANPAWYDLAEVHAAKKGCGIVPTLDFNRNPRWMGEDQKQIPVACDRIYLMDNAVKFDYGVENVGIFGTGVSPETGLSPSDHYGLLAELSFLVL